MTSMSCEVRARTGIKAPKTTIGSRGRLCDPVLAEESEGDEDFGQFAKPLVDVVAAVIPDAQPAELMKPADRSLHHPTIHPQAAAVRRAPLGQLGVDAALP